MGGRVRAEKDGRIGWIVFDHPERRNAISVAMWDELPGAVAELAADDAVRVVVLRGAGETAFVSGADISEFSAHRTGDAARDYDANSARGTRELAQLDKPVLAMIHGFCFGGGVGLSLAADLRYASGDALFAVPAARLGVGYPPGGFEALVRLVGPSRAKEIFFTARRFTAREALAMGLVNAVVPGAELEALVRETADRIAGHAPLTLASVKIVARELEREPSRRDVEAMEASVRRCFESEDYREGARAFLEKRAPVFRGR